MGYETAIRFRDSGDRLELANGAELDFGGTVHLYDDFLGSALDARYSGGSATNGTDPAINAAAGGHVRMATGANGSNDLSSLTHALNWQADRGFLVFEARVQVDDVSDVVLNVGLSDELASSTAENPFTLDASDNLTSNASDAACFVYDTTGTSNWFAAGVAGDTDAGPMDLGVSPSASTFQVLRIVIDSSGAADFFIDGTYQASLDSAVSADTALTPIAAADVNASAARNLDVDFLRLRQDR